MKTLTLSVDLSKLKTDLTNERLGLPSASSAKKLAACPGSWRMEMGMPEIARYEESADTGQRIHEWLSGKKGTTLDAEELLNAQSMERGKEKLISEWMDTLPADVLGGEMAETSIEDRWFLHCGVIPVTSGRWDLLLRRGNHFLCPDYKSGWQELPYTKQNLQLRIYALLVYQKFPEADSISVATVRPGDDENEKAYFATYCKTELESAWLWWTHVLNAVFAERPALVAGEHCQFCKAQFTCAARISTLTTFHAEPEPMDWALVPAERKAELFRAWKEAKRMGEAIEEKVKADLAAGVKLPGITMGPKTKKGTEVDDVVDAYQRLVKAGVAHDFIMAHMKLGFAGLRDALRVKLAWKGKEADAKLTDLLGGKVTVETKSGSIQY